MKKNCEKFMEQFLALDKNEHLSFEMIFHLLLCSECRTYVRLFTKAEKLVAKQENLNTNVFNDNSVDDLTILQNIFPNNDKIKKVHIYNWIFIGTLLLACMILCSFFMNKYIPQLQELWFVFIAAVICTYCLIFIAMNLDFFIKLSDTHEYSVS